MDCLPIVTAATDVHHKQKLRDRPELKYEEENLMGLCKACHDKRTARGE
jgi:5-methylcytosine-specific restriction endonuclease McrA